MARFTPSGMARLMVIAAGTLAMVPGQLLAMRLGARAAHVFPVLYHRMLCRVLGLRIRVAGTPPGRQERGLIIANHMSWLDISVVGADRPVSFIGKSEIAGWPVFGHLARLQRTIFIDRSRRAATADVSQAMGERLAAGESLVLFAEGTTSDGTRLLPLKSSLIGAVHQALGAGHADITVWPLMIAYVGRRGIPGGRSERTNLAWYGDTELLPHLDSILRGGPIDVVMEWGAPIRMVGDMSRKDVARQVEASLRSALSRAITGRDQARA